MGDTWVTSSVTQKRFCELLKRAAWQAVSFFCEELYRSQPPWQPVLVWCQKSIFRRERIFCSPSKRKRGITTTHKKITFQHLIPLRYKRHDASIIHHGERKDYLAPGSCQPCSPLHWNERERFVDGEFFCSKVKRSLFPPRPIFWVRCLPSTHQPSLLCLNLLTTGEPLWYVKMRRINFCIYLTCSAPILTHDFFDRGQLALWQKDVHKAGLRRIGQAFDAWKQPSCSVPKVQWCCGRPSQTRQWCKNKNSRSHWMWFERFLKFIANTFAFDLDYPPYAVPQLSLKFDRSIISCWNLCVGTFAWHFITKTPLAHHHHSLTFSHPTSHKKILKAFRQ